MHSPTVMNFRNLVPHDFILQISGKFASVPHARNALPSGDIKIK
jgi:hypothetical protein